MGAALVGVHGEPERPRGGGAQPADEAAGLDVDELQPPVGTPPDHPLRAAEQGQLARSLPGGLRRPTQLHRGDRAVHAASLSNTCSCPQPVSAWRAASLPPTMVAMAALSDDQVREGLVRLPGWEREDDAIVRTYELPSFRAVIDFVGRIADAAEAADHHPDLDIRYSRLRVVLSTHSEGGITDQDFALAAQLDAAAP